jgi:putative hemolysin
MPAKNPFIEPGDSALIKIAKRILLRWTRCDGLCERLAGHNVQNANSMLNDCMRDFNWLVRVEAPAKQQISGPVLIVSNHPHGIVDGYLLAYVCERYLARDFRILSNQVAARVAKSLSPWMIPVDNQGPKNHRRAAYNKSQLELLKRFLTGNQAVVYFPAGEVSHWSGLPILSSVRDSEWFVTPFAILKQTNASILPVHISGRNSLAFLIARSVHRFLGRLFLFNEVVKSQDKEFLITIGASYAPDLNLSAAALKCEARGLVEALAGRASS